MHSSRLIPLLITGLSLFTSTTLANTSFDSQTFEACTNLAAKLDHHQQIIDTANDEGFKGEYDHGPDTPTGKIFADKLTDTRPTREKFRESIQSFKQLNAAYTAKGCNDNKNAKTSDLKEYCRETYGDNRFCDGWSTALKKYRLQWDKEDQEAKTMAGINDGVILLAKTLKNKLYTNDAITGYKVRHADSCSFSIDFDHQSGGSSHFKYNFNKEALIFKYSEDRDLSYKMLNGKILTTKAGDLLGLGKRLTYRVHDSSGKLVDRSGFLDNNDWFQAPAIPTYNSIFMLENQFKKSCPQ